MKKIFIFLMALMMSFGIANAQIATENSKFFDNTYVGVGGQVTTPLDFNGVFPLNGGVSVVLGKQLTPVFGLNFEDNVWFGSHANGDHPTPHFDGNSHNIVRGNYLGVNGTVNFMNLFAGYKGTPRFFETQGIIGLGWWHVFTPNASDKSNNDLAAKTGVNFLFNLGKKKAHSVYIQPAVLWNLTNPASTHYHVAFNKMGAQLAIQVGYVYHFKTSNGTHHFKTYDVGAMQAEITRLNEALQEKPREVIVEKVVTKEAPATAAVAEHATGFGVKESVYFAFDSAELDDRAKETLNQLGENGVYVVDAWASSEGTTEYNLKLSQRRADAVKAYLESRGAKVESATGHGVQFGTTTGRVAVVRLK